MITSNGYKTIKKSGYTKLEHRAVWEEYHGKIPKDHFIHHINGNKLDNRIENLECLSRIEHGKTHRIPNRKRICFSSGSVKIIKLLH